MLNESPLEDKVTVVVTTIGRDESVKRFVTSVRNVYTDLAIIAADQNAPTEEMEQFYRSQRISVLWMPYDCGLSYSRNRALEQVETEYALLADDDFIFSEKTDIESAIRICDADPGVGFLGGSITDLQTGGHAKEERGLRRWEKFFLLSDQTRTLISIPIDHLPLMPREIAGHTIYACDMTLNWGLFRTAMYGKDVRWDEDIKINGEHEDFFLNLKTVTNWQVAYFPGLQCDHQPATNRAYRQLRRRTQGRQVFAAKWNLTHHLEIGVGLRDHRDYQRYAETPVHHPELSGDVRREELETEPPPGHRRPKEHSAPGWPVKRLLSFAKRLTRK
jgi:glycosyltransferase involved in cell wall biosynthesis